MCDVDIVIPIYNAYDFVKKCIETVINNTDLKQHRLILINDMSTDTRIEPMLEEFVSKYSDLNIILKSNKENLGFVKTVNVGLKLSNNDVILLNSDTEVTFNWVEKMQNCAYSQEMVSTVTPLSNNATLASVPIPMVENSIPSGFELQEYAELVEKVSMNLYPQIPTGHGFCLYITRKSLNDVGLFDDITFEKGYGEENDFCYRALELGYKHLLCDNTYIYHKGTQSFSKEKEEMIASHLKILQEKYPVNYENTNNFVLNYPISYIQKNIMIYTQINKKKNILFVIHDFRELSEKNLGGTTLHIYDLINGLRKYFNFFILFPDKDFKDCYFVKAFFEDYEAEIEMDKIQSYTNFYLYNTEYGKMVENIIDMFKIDLIHIHHFKEHYMDLVDIAKKRNIYTMITLHDYYTICPTIQMLNEDTKYCALLEEKNCEKCLKKKLNCNSNIIPIWQNEWRENLKKFDKIIVPSNTAKFEIEKVYSDLEIDVIYHGSKKYDIFENDAREKNTFNIAFLGGINEHKGFNVLKFLVDNLNDDTIKIHLFGTTSDNNYNESKGNYTYHGIYERDNLINLLKENCIDLVCLLSIWPETFSYTLTESIMAEIPIITYNIGAINERISNEDAGYIIDINSTPEDVMKKIVYIKNNKDEFLKKKDNVKKLKEKEKTLNEMCNEYKKIYENVPKENIMYNDISDMIKLEYLKNDYVNEKRKYIYKLVEQRGELDEYDKCLKIAINNNKKYETELNDFAKSFNELKDYNNRVEKEHTQLVDEYKNIINSKRWKLINKVIPNFNKGAK